MNRYWLTCILLITSLQVFSFGGSPVPLRTLVLHADLVLVADVEVREVEMILGYDKDSVPKSYLYSPDGIAKLTVQEVWKGKTDSTLLHVHFDPLQVCPSPARYKNGTKVLTFLSKRPEGGFETYGRNWGVRILNEEEFIIFKKRIQEIREIQHTKEEKERHQQTINWLIECVRQPSTRRDGLEDLLGYGCYMRGQFEDGVLKIREPLNDTQLLELKKIFLAEDQFRPGALKLFDIIASQNDKEVMKQLLMMIKDSITTSWENRIYLAERYAQKSKKEALRQIIKWSKEIPYSDPDLKARQEKLLQQFIELAELSD